MPPQQILNDLRDQPLEELHCTLAVIRINMRNRIANYTIKYVDTDEQLENRLKEILIEQINRSVTAQPFTFDCPEPEEDLVRSLDIAETDFYRIQNSLQDLIPEEDKIQGVEELERSRAYLIIGRNQDGIVAVGYKTLVENWKLRRQKGLISLLFNENRFEPATTEEIFSISQNLDLISFRDQLFIRSKKNFEFGLNFRAGMIEKAEILYEELEANDLIVNIDLLKSHVGNNKRYLRKLAVIRNLGHYSDNAFLQRLRQVSQLKAWNIEFDGNQIVITEDNLDDVLTLLQNKRLHSELTEQDFDVESVTLIEG